MDENYIDSYKFERTQPLGATFGDLDPEEQKLFKGNIADFGVDTFAEGKEELNDNALDAVIKGGASFKLV